MRAFNDRAAAMLAAATLTVLSGFVPVASAAPGGAKAEHARIVEHWSPARRAAAVPRDFVLDEHGQSFLRRADGSLEPYGRRSANGASAKPQPQAKPGTGGPPPDISNLDPGEDAVIGSSHTFKATITDTDGLRTVRFVIRSPSGTSQTFSPAQGAGDVWSVALSGFTNGAWTWTVEAKDKSGASSTAGPIGFTVNTGGGGGGGGGVVTNAPWPAAGAPANGGAVQTAAGRIYFEMPSNSRRSRWAGYVCSGTVVTDTDSGRSLILTAAHCVYDDKYKAFARNVLFIPNQDGTTGSGTDTNCSNDPLGCWTPAFGVVDSEWSARQFPDNIPWDYAFYVVNDGVDSHTGNGSDGRLDAIAGALPIDFGAPHVDEPGTADYSYALGYSYSDDPNFMYCAEEMTREGNYNWWLPSCDLSGGSSGGPWVQPMNLSNGSGTLISVNSWGYTTTPGMAGPRLDSDTNAACLFSRAKALAFPVAPADGNAGYVEGC